MREALFWNNYLVLFAINSRFLAAVLNVSKNRVEPGQECIPGNVVTQNQGIECKVLFC